MKFSTREDIEAPLAAVWQTLTDFEHWERAALRRGADVARTDTPATPGAQPAWRIGFSYRGKPREVDLRLTAIDQPQALAFAGEGRMLEGVLRLELVELGARRTRISVAFEVLPRTIAARLFLQSLRLARGRLERRFKQRAAALATMIEARNPGARVL